MRTTLNIDDDLHAALKRLAAATNRSLTEVLEDAIRALLTDVERTTEEPPPTFPTFDGGQQPGLVPGVDLDDTASLLDLVDRPDGAAA